MSMIPENLRYTKTHEWVKEEDGLSVVGLTDFAQSELGDIVFVNLPEVGDEVVVFLQHGEEKVPGADFGGFEFDDFEYKVESFY